MNPFQLISLMKNRSNPMQFMMNALSQSAQGNPMLTNVLRMAQNGDSKGIEQVARNLAQEKGVDVDSMLNQIQSMLK